MNGRAAVVFCSTVAELLKSDNRVLFSAPGHSMRLVILPSDVLEVAPIQAEELSIGDIALYHSGDRIVAHRVVRIQKKAVDHGCDFAPFSFSSPKIEDPLCKSHFLKSLLRRNAYLTRFFPQGAQRRSSNPVFLRDALRAKRSFLSLSAPNASPPGEPPAPQAQRSFLIQITLRGDACATPDPPITAEQILGKVVSVERNGRYIEPYSLSSTIYAFAYRTLARLIRLFR